MKKVTDWDHYFYSHYKSQETDWGMKDLDYYRKWYYSWVNYIDSIVQFKKNTALFEVGSGIGGSAAEFSDIGLKVTGSDISRKIVSAAQSTNKKIKFIYCDIMNSIPLKKKFDYVVAFEVIEHLIDPDSACVNIYSHLKRDGFFIASTPFPYPKAYTDPTHCNVKYPIEWKVILKRNGFKNISTRPMSFIPFLWKLNKHLNPVVPFYIPFNGIVSTTLIIAKK